MEECQKYGTILAMKIPRPSMGSRQSAGVGKIFIKYEDPEQAKKALQALAGRKFADRTVVTTFFDEVCSSPVLFWAVFSFLVCRMANMYDATRQASFDVNAW